MRLDPERRVRHDADAAEREPEDVVGLADPVERERELGARALRPDTRFLWIDHPPVSEPAVVAQVVQLDRIARANVKAPLTLPPPERPSERAGVRAQAPPSPRHRRPEAALPRGGGCRFAGRRRLDQPSSSGELGLFDLEREIDLAVGRRAVKATRCATPDRRS